MGRSRFRVDPGSAGDRARVPVGPTPVSGVGAAIEPESPLGVLTPLGRPQPVAPDTDSPS